MKNVIILVGFVFLISCANTKMAALMRLKSMRASDYFPQGPQLELVEAGEKGKLEKISQAIDQGAKINYVGNQQITPLIWALIKQNKIGYRELLKRGADPNLMTKPLSKYKQGQSAIAIAAIHEDPEYLRLALEHGGNANAPSWAPTQTILFEAVGNRRFDNIKQIKERGGDLNHQDRSGVTPLIAATFAAQFDIVYLLLELGADPTIENSAASNLADILIKYEDRGVDLAGQSFQHEWYQKVVKEMKRRGLMR